MEINNNRHNILSSNIAPNPMSVKYWADLAADPSGAVIKTYKDGKWTAINNDSVSEDLTALQNEVKNKVDKVDGKSLSTNDYTTAEKNKLSGLSNYNDAEVRELISNLTIKVGTLEERVAALETPAA